MGWTLLTDAGSWVEVFPSEAQSAHPRAAHTARIHFDLLEGEAE